MIITVLRTVHFTNSGPTNTGRQTGAYWGDPAPMSGLWSDESRIDAAIYFGSRKCNRTSDAPAAVIAAITINSATIGCS